MTRLAVFLIVVAVQVAAVYAYHRYKELKALRPKRQGFSLIQKTALCMGLTLWLSLLGAIAWITDLAWKMGAFR